MCTSVGCWNGSDAPSFHLDGGHAWSSLPASWVTPVHDYAPFVRVRHELLSAICGTATPSQIEGSASPVVRELRPSSRRIQGVLRRIPGRTRRGVTIAAEPEFVWYRVAKVASRSLVTGFHAADVRFIADHPYGVVVPRALIKGFFAFTFVRDPRTRLVSAWQDKIVRSNAFGLPSNVHSELQDFPRFVDWVSSHDLREADGHLRLQVSQVDIHRVDFVGRFESLREDVEHVRCRLGLSEFVLPHRNASAALPDVYNAQLLRRVEDLYRPDLEAFGY